MKRVKGTMMGIWRWLRKPMQAESGFTLIELLVVVAVMGVLAAVAVPNVARFAGRGQSEARNTELLNVQTALDAYMADKKLTTVTAATATTTYTDFALVIPNGTDPLYPDYIRQQTASSGVSYCWNTAGKVTQNIPAAAC